MSYDFRLPNINAETEAGRLAQMQSYLYQLVQNLNWALNSIETNGGSGSIQVLQKTDSSGSIAKPEVADIFAELKPLIINSADIVSAYTERIERVLKGEYVAESDFGTYTETVSARFEETATAMTQYYTEIQTIGEMMAETNKYIRTGKLDTVDNEDIFGLEVGETAGDNFTKYARFTANGIYFYPPNSDTAIAYMDSTMLHITNAEVTGQLHLGNYYITASADHGLVFMWAGGGN